MVQREAAFLIARATEEFVARLAEAAQRVAAREQRTTVQGKDLGACSALSWDPNSGILARTDCIAFCLCTFELPYVSRFSAQGRGIRVSRRCVFRTPARCPRATRV